MLKYSHRYFDRIDLIHLLINVDSSSERGQCGFDLSSHLGLKEVNEVPYLTDKKTKIYILLSAACDTSEHTAKCDLTPEFWVGFQLSTLL